MEPIPNLNTNQNPDVPVKNPKAEETPQEARLNEFNESLFKNETSQIIRNKEPKTGKSDPIKKLPPELIRIIASDPHLSPKDLGQASAVSKSWKASDALEEEKIKASIIGVEEYKRLLNVEVDDLPIPQELIEYLKSPSVIDPKVPTMAKTMVVLIPKTMKTKDDAVPKPTTLKSYKEIIEKVMKEKFGSNFNGYIYDRIFELYGEDKAIEESFYLVMTTEVLPGTLSQPYVKQLEIAQENGYEPPSLLPAFIGITMRFLKTGVTHYGQEPVMYTRCKEAVDGYQTVIGCVGASGFVVSYDDFGFVSSNIGLAGAWQRSFF